MDAARLAQARQTVEANRLKDDAVDPLLPELRREAKAAGAVLAALKDALAALRGEAVDVVRLSRALTALQASRLPDGAITTLLPQLEQELEQAQQALGATFGLALRHTLAAQGLAVEGAPPRFEIGRFAVEADFGRRVASLSYGKNVVAPCVRDRAWERNFAVSKVELSPKESPYDDQRRVYAAVASSIIWHELGDLGEDERGLTRFLEGTLRRVVQPQGLDLEDPGAAELPDVRALLQTLETTPVDSLSFHKAIQVYFMALLRGQELRQESLGRWLHGEEVSPEDMRDLRAVGVTEKITKNNAFKMLRSLCQVVRALGYTGLALLFDEGDRMLSVGGRSEKVATDNLREVIDRCREDLPGAMFLYAVPPVFIHDVVPKYPALQQRIQTPNYFSRSNPFSPQINLDRLDVPDDELLTGIGSRLLAIFEVAYDIKLDAEIQARNIAALSRAARESYLAISRAGASGCPHGSSPPSRWRPGRTTPRRPLLSRRAPPCWS